MKRTVFIFALLWSTSIAAQDSIIKFRILHTSDVHGAVFDYDFINDRLAKTSLMHANEYINAVRDTFGNHLLLLDGGDNLQGQPPVYYFNFIATTQEHVLARIMNAMGYDAAAVGNHDIETGHLVYDRVARQYNFPLLAANAVKPDGKPYFVPYVVFDRDGVKIAVLGMTNPHIPSWLPKILWEGMSFQGIAASSAYWMEYIRGHESPDIVIGLFHAGMGDGTDGEEDPSLYVAQTVPGFDVVFIGHDHQRAVRKIVNTRGDSVLIMDPANAARFVSDVTITLKKENGRYVKETTGKLVNVAGFKADNKLQVQFEKEMDDIKAFVSKPIGTFEKSISTRAAYFGPSAFIDLIHRIQLEVAGADISFAAPLSFDAEIKEGTVYVRDMFNLYRFENMLYTMELTGTEIKGYLNYSYANWLNRMQSPKDHLLLFSNESTGKSGQFTVPPYNFDSAAGILYEVDVTRPAANKVTIISMADGTPFSETEKYRVAINSYRGNGGGGLLQYGAKIAPEDFDKRILQSTDIDLRYYMMNWIERTKTINPEPLYHWKIVPENWVKEATKRDYEILFGKE